MKILVACETSGTVRNAFLDKGHDTWSCDVLPSDDQTNRHIQDDVRNVLAMEEWDMLMVAHPPCTRLCNSGVRWLHKAPPNKTLEQIWAELDEGAKLFSDLWNADIPKICIENPVMHKYAKERIENFEKQAQSFQPYEFGHDENSWDNQKKRICLWLKNLPLLEKTGTLDGSTARSDVHNAPPSEDRWKFRSKFFPGIAQAMADQWGTDG